MTTASIEDHLCFSLYSTWSIAHRTFKSELGELDLTYPQYLVMMILSERDGQSVKSIGERIFLDSSTLTPLLKRLEAKGWVKRERDFVDQRQVNISLTPEGRVKADEAGALPDCLSLLSGLPECDIKALKDKIDSLRDTLHAQMSA